LVDLQKSGNDSQTSKAGDANLGGGTGGDGSRDTGGGNDGHLSGRDHGNGGSRDGRVGVAAGAGESFVSRQARNSEVALIELTRCGRRPSWW
jgi:hypothetical protein